MPKSTSKPIKPKMPVAGKSGKDGVTANLRIKDEPKPVSSPGQFTDKVRIKAGKPVKQPH